MSNMKGARFMDGSTVIGLLKYLFMGVFLLFFIMDVLSRKSYKIFFYTSLTLAIIFLVLGQSWSPLLKTGAIVLVVLLTIKTIVDESAAWANRNSRNEEEKR